MRRAFPGWLRWLVRIALTLALLFAGAMLIDPAELMAAMRAVDVAWLPAAFACSVIGTIVLPAMATRRALAIERLSFTLGELIAINLSMRFYVLVLPRFVSVGLRWHRYGRGRLGYDALALLGFERAVQFASLFALALVAVLLEAPRLGEAAIWATAIVALAAAASFAGLGPFLWPPAARLAAAIRDRAAGRLPAAIFRRLDRFTDAVTAFRGLDRRDVAAIALFSTTGIAFSILSVWFVVEAMAVEVSLAGLTWVRAVVFAMTLVPITVGGLGVREAGFIGFLALYGVPAEIALAFGLVIFALQVVIGAIGMVIEVVRFLRPKRADTDPREAST